MEWVVRLVHRVSGVVFGPATLLLLLGTGVWLTLRSGFFQFRRPGLWLGRTCLAALGGPRGKRTEQAAPKAPREAGSISPFEAMCTALAGTIGTGNIAGVATALAAGGPGAIFWMWLSALFGAMTSFAENTLGGLYRWRTEQGEWVGGPMVYLQRGLGSRALARLFALFALLASCGMGNLSQANAIASAVEAAAGVPRLATGLVLAGLTGLVLAGGVQRMARVAARLVPLMAALYLGGSAAVLAANAERLPAAFAAILRGAFDLRAGLGGVAGYGVLTALRSGMARGVFSNEAGLGSSVLAHAAANEREPAVLGMWGMFEVLTDTLVVCTLTALVILTSGVYDPRLYAMARGTDLFGLLAGGAVMTGNAFASVLGQPGRQLVALSLALFAFSSILCWSQYGERCLRYLWGGRGVRGYRVLFAASAVLGSGLELQLVWELADICNGLMALPNLAALWLLGGQALRELRRYRERAGDTAAGAAVPGAKMRDRNAPAASPPGPQTPPAAPSPHKSSHKTQNLCIFHGFSAKQ